MVTTRKRKNISSDPGPSSAPHRTSPPTFVQSLSDISAPISVDPADQPDWETLNSQAKARIDKYIPCDDRADHLLVPTLHAFLVWLPQAGREKVARDILADPSRTDEGLYGIYDHLRTSLLVPMKALGAKSHPVPSPIPHRQEDAQTISERASSPVGRSNWFVGACFQRDDSRCVVSKYLASTEWEERGKPLQEVPIDLEVVHIVPFSFGKYERTPAPGSTESSPIPKKKKKAATRSTKSSPAAKKTNLTSNDTGVCWSALYTCFPALREVIKASTVDEPSNGFLLAASLHSLFGKFLLAFKPIPDDNLLYEIVVYKSRGPSLPRFCDEGQKVRMNQHPEVASVNRSLLDLHWRLCEVFNASGAGEEIDRSLDKWDEIKERSGGMAADGSTNIGELLWYSLSTSHMPQPYSTKVYA